MLLYVNHLRTTNAHNTLSAQSDQPHCCLLLKYIYLVSSGSQLGVYLCILGMFNRNIWKANSNGSGQTCDGHLPFAKVENLPEEFKNLTKIISQVYNLFKC